MEWIPNTDESQVVLFVEIQTQMPTAFPTMAIKLTQQEIDSMTCAELTARCVEVIQYECANPVLLCKEKPLELKAEFKEIVKKAIVERHYSSCHNAESQHKKINHRVFHCEQLVSSEESYIRDLKEVKEYWQKSIEKSECFTQDQNQVLFRHILPIMNTHNLFLQILKSGLPPSFASEFGSKFLEFVYCFKISSAFVSKFKEIKERLKDRSFEQKWLEVEHRQDRKSVV
jgi:hypothetical protein